CRDAKNAVAYQALKEYSKNGDNYCKQLLSILQQRYEIEWVIFTILSAVVVWQMILLSEKASFHNIGVCILCPASRKLGKAIQTEAINPMNRILQDHEKKKKTVSSDNPCCYDNPVPQIVIKISLDGGKTLTNPSFESHPFPRNLEKSAIKLAKEDEDYYKKNLTACETRVKWEQALENGHQSILDLEKDRLLLLCNTLHRYSQLLSHFGQSLIAVSEADKDVQMLVKEMSVTAAETKLELLLTDYYEEDMMSLIEKERRQTAIKAKITRVQTDLEKALQDKTGLERMLQAYKETPQFSDAKNINDTIAQLNEATLKAALLQANHFKLGSALAEIEKKPKPTHPCNDCISKWKEKKKASTGSANSTTSLQPENSESRTCRAVYDYHAEREDELCLSKGDVIVIHHKDKSGWWYGSRKGKQGNFPATYVEEVTLATDRSNDEPSL
uniref:Nitric oxide synthase trafficking n=1 Tax=Pseudonaja textilis TaxID=8673 RepID=A0A670XUX0_PSETE